MNCFRLSNQYGFQKEDSGEEGKFDPKVLPRLPIFRTKRDSIAARKANDWRVQLMRGYLVDALRGLMIGGCPYQ